MPTIKSNGINLYYEEHGQGRPLVMMTGVGQWHEAWWRNVPELSRHFRVITFDARGIGDSDKPDIPYDVPMLVGDLLGLLDGLELERPHLVGHSLGGLISLELAMAHPERVDRLVIMSSLYPGPTFVPFTPEAAKLLFDRSGEPMELIKRGIRVSTAAGFEERDPEAVEKVLWLRLNSKQTPNLYLRQSTSGLEYLKTDQMRPFPNPVLLLYGREDQVVPPGNGERIAACLPNATLRLIDGAGHFLPIEQAAETNRQIVEFLVAGEGAEQP
jgi:pimeloyl-ACP methyl ester carboxylesterase